MLSVGESQVWGLEGKSPGTQSETDADLGHDFLLSDILKTQFFPSWYRAEGHLAAGDFSYKYQCFWHKGNFYLLFRISPPCLLFPGKQPAYSNIPKRHIWGTNSVPLQI